MKNMKGSKLLAYKDHFPISHDDIQKILDIALSRGGDFSEIFLEYKVYNFITMEEDIIKETAESISLGLGVRVLSGEKTGFGYTNDLALEKISKAALTAASIASGQTPQHAIPPSLHQTQHNFYPIMRSAHEESLESKISLVKKAYSTAQKFDPKIINLKHIK